MYIKEIKDMINLMNENGLTELEIEKEGVRIRLKKGSQGGFDKSVEFSIPNNAPSHDKRESLQQEQAKKNTIDIKAPMVGTFYRAASPEAPSYASIGDTIEPGQVVCIIEAMKLMNEIKSDVRGKITDIQVENAEPVEFGQVLFVLEPL